MAYSILYIHSSIQSLTVHFEEVYVSLAYHSAPVENHCLEQCRIVNRWVNV
jgi:hypothetical protein